MPRWRGPKPILAATERCGNNAPDWNTVFTGLRCGGIRVISSPFSVIDPADGVTKPPIARSNVVLPEPDPPNRTNNSPRRTVRVSLSTAVTSPKRTVRPSMRRSSLSGRALNRAQSRVRAAPPAGHRADGEISRHFGIRGKHRRVGNHRPARRNRVGVMRDVGDARHDSGPQHEIDEFQRGRPGAARRSGSPACRSRPPRPLSARYSGR